MTKKSILLTTLVAILGLALGYAVSSIAMPAKSDNNNKPTNQNSQSKSPKTQTTTDQVSRPGSMTLKFSQKQVQVGASVNVSLNIDTSNEAINGFDAQIKFNPQDWSTKDKELLILKSSKFSLYPQNIIDSQKGEIKFSALTDPDYTVSGQNTVASFNLIPQRQGKLELKFVFTKPGDTLDSNLAQTKTGEDILGRVVNASIIVTAK